LGDEEKGETSSLEEVMPDSSFTETERSSQRLFRKLGVCCERFSRSYGLWMSPEMIRLRSLWFQIHKWLGITLAVLIIPISLTGAALVWHDWIDRQLYPDRYPAAASAGLPPSAYASGAMKLALPGERISALKFSFETGAVQATLTKQSPGGGRPSRAMIWLNAQTVAPIERGAPRDGLLGVLHVVHGSLMVPGVGRQIVGWIGVAMLLSSLTGIWLWWPLKGSFTRGLRWRRRPDFNSNLHHTGGFWIALPLAVLSATGVWISFPAVFNPANRAQPGPAQPLATPEQTPDEALASARLLVPGELDSITWPTEKKADWTVAVKGDGKPVGVTVRDSDATASVKPAEPETLARTMRRIHDGTGMVLVWRIIIFVGGILPAALAVTGILMWLRMRRRREKHRRSATAFAEAEALAN
jgi:uncharacterized iron-regulated membrane protein